MSLVVFLKTGLQYESLQDVGWAVANRFNLKIYENMIYDAEYVKIVGQAKFPEIVKLFLNGSSYSFNVKLNIVTMFFEIAQLEIFSKTCSALPMRHC